MEKKPIGGYDEEGKSEKTDTKDEFCRDPRDYKPQDQIAVLFKEAKEEVRKEIRDDAKVRIKRKMKELKAAERVVANIIREIEELKLDISQELSNV
jgi:hypothetical protein